VSVADVGVDNINKRYRLCDYSNFFTALPERQCWGGFLRAGFILPCLLLLSLSVATVGKSGIPDAVIRWVEAEYGNDARERVEGWSALIGRYQTASEADKLEAVNDFFNEIQDCWLKFQTFFLCFNQIPGL